LKEKKKTGRMIDSWHLAEACFAEAAGVSLKLKSTTILQPYK